MFNCVFISLRFFSRNQRKGLWQYKREIWRNSQHWYIIEFIKIWSDITYSDKDYSIFLIQISTYTDIVLFLICIVSLNMVWQTLQNSIFLLNDLKLNKIAFFQTHIILVKKHCSLRIEWGLKRSGLPGFETDYGFYVVRVQNQVFVF